MLWSLRTRRFPAVSYSYRKLRQIPPALSCSFSLTMRSRASYCHSFSYPLGVIMRTQFPSGSYSYRVAAHTLRRFPPGFKKRSSVPSHFSTMFPAAS